MPRTYPKSDYPDKYLLKPSTRPADELISPLLKLEELCARTRRGPAHMADILLSDISKGRVPAAVHCRDGVIYDLPVPLTAEEREELRQAIAEAFNAGTIDVPIDVDDTYGYLLFCCCVIDEVYPWQYKEDQAAFDRLAEESTDAKRAPSSETAEAEETRTTSDESVTGSSRRALEKVKEDESAITRATKILRQEFEARVDDPKRAQSNITQSDLYKRTIPKANRQWFTESRFKEKVWKPAHKSAGVETPQGRPSEKR